MMTELSESDRLKKEGNPLLHIVDSGLVNMTQQINTFKVLFDHIKPGGVFLCEDTHTSYFDGYGGGQGVANTYMNYCKNLVDELNGYHSNKITNITKRCSGMHFYDSIVVFD